VKAHREGELDAAKIAASGMGFLPFGLGTGVHEDCKDNENNQSDYRQDEPKTPMIRLKAAILAKTAKSHVTNVANLLRTPPIVVRCASIFSLIYSEAFGRVFILHSALCT